MRSPYTPVSLRLRKWMTDSGYGVAFYHATRTASKPASAIGPGGHSNGQHNHTTLQVHFDLHETGIWYTGST